MILVLVLYAILLYLYIHTFYYLKKAEHTGCFTPKVNLKYMQFFQLLEIVALTLTVLFFPYFLKMKAKNNDTITLTIDLIESISNSQFYESDKNFLKMYSILNIILSVLENLISSSENVCNSINGQLKGLSIIDGNKKITEP